MPTKTRLQDLETPAQTHSVEDAATVAAEAADEEEDADADEVKDEGADVTVPIDANLETSRRYTSARQEDGSHVTSGHKEFSHRKHSGHLLYAVSRTGRTKHARLKALRAV